MDSGINGSMSGLTPRRSFDPEQRPEENDSGTAVLHWLVGQQRCFGL